MDIMKCKHPWKELVERMLLLMRVLFTFQVSWDFFLTIGFSTSQRALVLTGLSSGFSSVITGLWAICIIGLLLLVLYHFFVKQCAEQKSAKFAYTITISCAVLYAALLCIGLFSTIVAWPVILNYMVTVGWAVGLIYFRMQLSKIDCDNECLTNYREI